VNFISDSVRHLGQSSVADSVSNRIVSDVCINWTCASLQGKSLSLICGSLSWLRDFEKRQKMELNSLLDSKLYVLRWHYISIQRDFEWYCICCTC